MTDDTPLAPPRRGRGRPGYDQATVLRRAIELFNTQGYDATSMGDLAADLGLGKSALYHHVPGKAHLLGAALDEALEGLERVIDAARERQGRETAYLRLRAAVRESVEVLLSHQPSVTLLLRVRGNSQVELDAMARRRKIDEALAALVQEAVDEGAVRADLAPDVVSRLLFGMVNSLIEWYSPDGRVDPGELADTVTELAFGGLVSAPARPVAPPD